MEGSPEDDLEVNPDLLVEHTIHVPTFDLESTMAAPPIPTHEKFVHPSGSHDMIPMLTTELDFDILSL